MPRCAKRKRLLEWLDRWVVETAGSPSAHQWYFMDVPRWAYRLLIAEGVNLPRGIPQLPCGRQVRWRGSLRDEAVLHHTPLLGPPPRVNISRFRPRTQAPRRTEGEVRRPSEQRRPDDQGEGREGRPLSGYITVDSLPSPFAGGTWGVGSPTFRFTPILTVRRGRGRT